MKNDMILSKRLQAIMNEVNECAVLADIGTDHAYIPCYACLQGYVTSAIAADVADGPLAVASLQVKACGLEEHIQLRKGSGLSVLTPHEVDTIVIAGMGGPLMVEILSQDTDKLEGVSQLVLQPNSGEPQVRKWLAAHGWFLQREAIIKEDQHIYEILTAVPGQGEAPYVDQSEFAWQAGPYLMHEQSTIFQEKWKHEYQKWQRIYQALNKAQSTAKNEAKKRSIATYIQQIKEML